MTTQCYHTGAQNSSDNLPKSYGRILYGGGLIQIALKALLLDHDAVAVHDEEIGVIVILNDLPQLFLADVKILGGLADRQHVLFPLGYFPHRNHLLRSCKSFMGKMKSSVHAYICTGGPVRWYASTDVFALYRKMLRDRSAAGAGCP